MNTTYVALVLNKRLSSSVKAIHAHADKHPIAAFHAASEINLDRLARLARAMPADPCGASAPETQSLHNADHRQINAAPAKHRKQRSVKTRLPIAGDGVFSRYRAHGRLRRAALVRALHRRPDLLDRRTFAPPAIIRLRDFEVGGNAL